jgi:hypothetical protein
MTVWLFALQNGQIKTILRISKEGGVYLPLADAVIIDGKPLESP